MFQCGLLNPKLKIWFKVKQTPLMRGVKAQTPGKPSPGPAYSFLGTPTWVQVFKLPGPLLPHLSAQDNNSSRQRVGRISKSIPVELLNQQRLTHNKHYLSTGYSQLGVTHP